MGHCDIAFLRRPVNRGASRWVYRVPQPGKNTVAFKVWVSWQMRDDLQVLAIHAGVTLSSFVREALIGALLGRGSLPERPEIMGQASTAALAWERDEPVKLAEIEEAEFDGLGDAERVWLEDEHPDEFDKDLASNNFLSDRGREGRSSSPPSEPCVRFSRTRLSSQWFPHRDWLANIRACVMVNRPN